MLSKEARATTQFTPATSQPLEVMQTLAAKPPLLTTSMVTKVMTNFTVLTTTKTSTFGVALETTKSTEEI